jgi:hypothetical protein
MIESASELSLSDEGPNLADTILERIKDEEKKEQNKL